MDEKTSNIPISPKNSAQLTNKQVKKQARAESERKRKDGEAKRNIDDEEALKEALQPHGITMEPIQPFENLPDIDEIGNAVNDEEESGKIFQIFCETYQSSPVTNYETETPREYLPYNPLN